GRSERRIMAMSFSLPACDGPASLCEGDCGAVVGELHAAVDGVQTRLTLTGTPLASCRVALAKLDLVRERRLGLFDRWRWVCASLPATPPAGVAAPPGQAIDPSPRHRTR